MTINQLIKKLQKIQDKHGKRVTVCINTSETKNYSADFSHHDLNVVEVDVIRWSKDDNYELADGSERMKKIVSVQ